MNVFSVFQHLQKDKQRKQRHSLKLGKKRRESSKRNYYIISPRVIIKAIIIISKDGKTTRQYQKSAIHPFVDGQSAISTFLGGMGWFFREQISCRYKALAGYSGP